MGWNLNDLLDQLGQVFRGQAEMLGWVWSPPVIFNVSRNHLLVHHKVQNHALSGFPFHPGFVHFKGISPVSTLSALFPPPAPSP